MVTRSTDKVCAAWVTARQHYQWISFSLQPQIFCQPTPFCYWAVFADYPQTAGEFAASSDWGVGMYPRFAILNSCKKLPVPSFRHRLPGDWKVENSYKIRDISRVLDDNSISAKRHFVNLHEVRWGWPKSNWVILMSSGDWIKRVFYSQSPLKPIL